jgi:hypothetical protein
MNEIFRKGIDDFSIYIRIKEEKLTLKEAFFRIQSEEENWEKGSEISFDELIKSHPKINPNLTNVLCNINQEKIKPGHVVVFGASSSAEIILLLEKGHTVSVVDSSGEACKYLETVANIFNSGWVENGKMKLSCDEIDNYKFPKNVQIILANDYLSHCSPTKIRSLWDNAYQSLEKNGRIIGSFFENDPNEEMNEREKGVWYTSKPIVTALLQGKNYYMEILEYNKYWFESGTRSIEFIGKKV